MTVDDAMREGTYLAVLPVLRNTSVHKASQLTNVPESAIRDAIKRFDMTGSVAPNKRGRKEGSGRMSTNESLEGLQDFIDERPESTREDVKEFLRVRHGVEAHIATIRGFYLI